jgi:hypothetical protein
MKKMNTGLVVIISILALYGLIILGRKIMNRNDEQGKFKGLKYFAEPYSITGCSCNKKGFFGGCKSGDCCSVPKEKLLSGTSLTDKEREALVYCPGYLDACKEHIISKNGQVPPNVVTACMNPSTIQEVAKKMF